MRVVVLTQESRDAFMRLYGAELARMKRELDEYIAEELEATARVLSGLSVAIDPQR